MIFSGFDWTIYPNFMIPVGTVTDIVNTMDDGCHYVAKAIKKAPETSGALYEESKKIFV